MTDHDHIPVVNIVGPGSQPEELGDGELNYMSMPATMSTFEQPPLPEPDEIGDISQALYLLENVADALKNHCENTVFDLSHLNNDNKNLVNQILGVGEVSATIDGIAPIAIQESVMAGLWRVHYQDAQGNVVKDCIEVGSIPSAISELAFANANNALDSDFSSASPHAMNAPAILVELADKIKHFDTQQTPHIINLTLLPLSQDDIYLLGERLGVGPVTILSRGYGNCRIGSTAHRGVWWIKYYNSDDALILNTLEVVTVPEVALAAPEDITDSAQRLDEILAVYR